MFDFDPRDRDDDVRDVEMPWIELGHRSGLNREQDECRDRDPWMIWMLRMGWMTGLEPAASGATDRRSNH
jgi:hypothetical protein